MVVRHYTYPYMLDYLATSNGGASTGCPRGLHINAWGCVVVVRPPGPSYQ